MPHLDMSARSGAVGALLARRHHRPSDVRPARRIVIDRQAGPPDGRTGADLTQVGQAVPDQGGDLLARFGVLSPLSTVGGFLARRSGSRSTGGGVNVVPYLARVDLRRRWLTWVGIALLLGLTAGASLFALAGARRTASSYARFLRSVNPSTIVVISPAGLPVDEQRAAAVPGVASSRMEVGFSVAVLDHGAPRLAAPWPDLDTVGTFDGRFFDQDRFVATEG